jgi:hypothetical protein
MQVSIYSNGNQECERASSLLEAVHLDNVVSWYSERDFTVHERKRNACIKTVSRYTRLVDYIL